MMSIVEGLLLGLIQAITQFLPVSFVGHQVLGQQFFSLDEIHSLAFTGVFYGAITCALVLYFKAELWMLLQALLRKLGRLPVNKRDVTVLFGFLSGAVPAVFFVVFVGSFIARIQYTVEVVAAISLGFVLFLMFTEWRYYLRPVHETVTAKRGLLVGLFHILAVMPGFSQTGAAIAGGMLTGLSRYEATRFAFMLAIPVTIGVALQQFLSLITSVGTIVWPPVIAGGLVGFFTSLVIIHLFLSFVRHNTLWPFIWYNVVLTALIWYVSFVS